MEWVEVFPAYRILMEMVQGRIAYLLLMNLSILLLLVVPVMAFLLTPRTRTPVAWPGPLAAALIALVLGGAVSYYFLFTDFGLITTEFLGNVLDFLARSLLGFAFFYCVCLPILTGFALFVFARSVENMIEVIRHPAPKVDGGDRL